MMIGYDLLLKSHPADVEMERIAQLERQLTEVARQSNACRLLMTVPGIGLITATGLVAATSGSVARFTRARHFASWFGLTPREHSSGGQRSLGRISKMGDRYLRTMLTHGARAVLQASAASAAKGKELTGINKWGLEVRQRTNHNKATYAVANKMARIAYGVLRDQRAARPSYKRRRTLIQSN